MGLGSLNSNALNTIPLNGGGLGVMPPSSPEAVFGYPLDAECVVFQLFAEPVLQVCEIQDSMQAQAEDRTFAIPRVDLR